MIREQANGGFPDEFPWHWKCILAAVFLTLSVLWFVKAPAYESGISLLSSAVVLGGLMLTGGHLGAALAGGFFLGAILSPFAIYKLYTEPTYGDLNVQVEADRSDLARQNHELMERLKQAMSQNHKLIEARLRDANQVREIESVESQLNMDVGRIAGSVPEREEIVPKVLDRSCDE